MSTKHKITLLFALMLSAVLLLALSSTPALAAAKIFTVPNNTGQAANDLHLVFGTTPTLIDPNIPAPFTGSSAPPYTSKITFDGGTVATGSSVSFEVQTAGSDINFTAYWTLDGKIIKPEKGSGYTNGQSYSYTAQKVTVSIYPYLKMTMPDAVDLGATFYGDTTATTTFPVSIKSNTSWGVYVSGEDFQDVSGAGNTMPISQLGVRQVGDPGLLTLSTVDQLFMEGSGSAPAGLIEYELLASELTPPGDYEATVHWMAVAL